MLAANIASWTMSLKLRRLRHGGLMEPPQMKRTHVDSKNLLNLNTRKTVSPWISARQKVLRWWVTDHKQLRLRCFPTTRSPLGDEA